MTEENEKTKSKTTPKEEKEIQRARHDESRKENECGQESDESDGCVVMKSCRVVVVNAGVDFLCPRRS
jgi:hypothetical protein